MSPQSISHPRSLQSFSPDYHHTLYTFWTSSTQPPSATWPTIMPIFILTYIIGTSNNSLMQNCQMITLWPKKSYSAMWRQMKSGAVRFWISFSDQIGLIWLTTFDSSQGPIWQPCPQSFSKGNFCCQTETCRLQDWLELVKEFEWLLVLLILQIGLAPSTGSIDWNTSLLAYNLYLIKFDSTLREVQLHNKTSATHI